MANLLFGYRLLEADQSTAVTGTMKASTFGDATDQGRLYYLELYAERAGDDTGGSLRLDTFDVELTINDTILASLRKSLSTQTYNTDGISSSGVFSDTRWDDIAISSALPSFVTKSFNDTLVTVTPEGSASPYETNKVRFAAGSVSNIGKGAGLVVDAGERKVLARVTLDIHDTWDTNSAHASPTPAIGGATVNLDETVATILDNDVNVAGNQEVVKSLRELRSIASTVAGTASFDSTVTTDIARADQSLAAKGAASAGLDDAFAERIGTTRTVGLAGPITTNLVRKNSVFTDTAVIYNDGESTLTSVNAVKTGSIANGTVVLDFEQSSNNGAAFTAAGSIAGADSSNSLADVNFTIDNTGAVTERGEIRVTRTLTATGNAGTVLVQNGAGGININAYADGASTQGTIHQIAGTTSKNLITYQGDLNYDGRVSMKDLAFLNAGAAAYAGGAGTYHQEVDADFNGSFTVGDLAILDEDWGKTLHTGSQTYQGVADVTWSELSSQGSGAYTWNNDSFVAQNAVENASGFEPTL
jgi:hypothetical protein